MRRSGRSATKVRKQRGCTGDCRAAQPVVDYPTMKRKLRGIKRSDIQLDFDLYRVNVPMPGVVGDQLSVINIRPEGVERTIVFVHGYAGCAETWERQINYFAKEYRVVVPDLRGHGQSDAPYTRYAMPELVADLYAISQHLRCPRSSIWWGIPSAARSAWSMPAPILSRSATWC